MGTECAMILRPSPLLNSRKRVVGRAPVIAWIAGPAGRR